MLNFQGVGRTSNMMMIYKDTNEKCLVNKVYSIHQTKHSNLYFAFVSAFLREVFARSYSNGIDSRILSTLFCTLFLRVGLITFCNSFKVLNVRKGNNRNA